MQIEIETTKQSVETLYKKIRQNLAVVRKQLGHPLTLAEKILYGHLDDPEHQNIRPGESFLLLQPDRIAMQDATAQMALLQFMQSGRKQTAVPTTVHCDHLIRAQMGALKDLQNAREENREVYDFLKSVSNKYGIGFWQPGAGIIHQVVLENYAFPGGMMLGTDSHTPNAGGLCMVAVGVGGADAVDVMAGMPWEVKAPKFVGVKLTGELSGWTAPKDVILKVCEILTTKGGTNRIVAYFGPGTRSISATGKATMTNMGAELGATTSIFPFDEKSAAYLRATDRTELATIAEANLDLLTDDPEVEKHPEQFFEKAIEINLSELEPYVVGPHSPDVARPVSKLAAEVKEKQYPDALRAVLIGSCTNSSYEDIERSADVARQAAAKGLTMKIPFMVTPGSEQVYETIARDGQLKDLEKIGGTVLANACGPCIGQWKRDDIKPNEPNSILTSYNRNFPKRNDGNAGTMAFIGSPEIVVAIGLGGKLSFNPLVDALDGPNGKKVKLDAPRKAPDLPPQGFVRARSGYEAPTANPESVQVIVSPTSERLQLLEPFSPWDRKDWVELPLLLKAKGKCTTDHISPAGPWLRYRGHLDRISDNMFLGAVNAFTGEVGKTLNLLDKTHGGIAEIARAYKKAGLRWIVVGDDNYGEGSSREHAAMSPRTLGAAAIITRSFARIHETNLKKQGILPLTFADPADYDKVQETDRVSIVGLAQLTPGREVKCILHHADGTEDTFSLKHSLGVEQIAWFHAGSALNALSNHGNSASL